ncbi:DNA helicase PcrA [Kyrpidia spormannii]|uniref:ATP-dependent DNA helicase n=1 Tax=Kyrpidia spormannii TaxID=2055160 RepID=A0ACA8ZF42_9BACL|nr:DNA helicase PcrA [Kyrpidia spormannii]CAB3394810.1 ATP-dependent DNA helicase [Kyrpidia spormannii]
MAMAGEEALRAEALLAGLNDAQREAVRQTEGPLLILAGAGSGKTRVLTHRVAYLVATRKAPPWGILAITFTNKAAREMRERIGRLVGPEAEEIWVSTFHSYCVRVLRRHIEPLGFTRSFSILDASDQTTAVKQVLGEMNLDTKKFDPRRMAGAISALKNELITPSQAAERARDFFQEVVAQVYERYQEKLRANNALDFDDLLMKTVELWDAFPESLEDQQRRFVYLHVDEYQDTNHAQYELVKRLAQRRRNLCVVGDSDQAIYGWRGADVRNILDFEADYPDAKVIKLEQNYRSTGRILAAANAVIAHNRQRKEKRLWSDRPQGEPVIVHEAMDEQGEAYFVVEEIRNHVEQGGRYGDVAVLYRTNAQSRVLEEMMMKASIPYVMVGGVKFYERKEIKDLLAYLRILVNPRDDFSTERVVNVPKRGIGEGTLMKAAAFAARRNLSLYEALEKVDELEVSARAASGIRQFVDLTAALRAMMPFLSVTELVQEVLNRTGYREALIREDTLEAQSRLENLEEFLSVTQEFDRRQDTAAEGGLEAFLADVALVSDLDMAETEDGVVLMTLHSAKGLEFPVVFLVGMEEGIFPHSRVLDDPDQMEEERRLCYVGITRAMNRLLITRAQQRNLYGRWQANPPSRFLEEIPEALLQWSAPRRSLRDRAADPAPAAGKGAGVGPGRGAGKSEGGHLQVPSGFGADPAESWEVGDRVMHRKWGEGRVEKKDGVGEDTELVVAFAPPIGRRKLLVRFAPIRKIDQ